MRLIPLILVLSFGCRDEEPVNDPRVAGLQAEQDELAQRLEALEAARADQATSLGTLGDDLEALTEALATSQGDLARLQTQLDALDALLGDGDAGLTAVLDELRDDVAAQGLGIGALESVTTSLRARLDVAEPRLDDVEIEAATAQGRINVLEVELGTQSGAITSLSTEVAAAQATIQAQQTEIGGISVQLDALAATQQQLSDALDALDASSASAADARAELSTRIGTLEADSLTAADLEPLQTAVAEHTQQLSNLATALDDLAALSASARDDLAAEIALRMTLTDGDALQSQLDTQASGLADAQADALAALAAIGTLEGLNDGTALALDALDDRTSAIEAELIALDASIEANTGALSALEGDLDAGLDALQSSLDAVGDDVTALQTDATSQRADLDLLSLGLSTLTSSVADNTAAIGTLASDVADNAAAIGTLTSDVADNTTAIADLSAEALRDADLDPLRSASTALGDRVDTIEATYATSATVSGLDDDLSALADLVAALEAWVPYLDDLSATLDPDPDAGEVTIVGSLTATSDLRAEGRRFGESLNFLECGGVTYNCTPLMCKDLCRSRGERMATADEVLAWAAVGRNSCRWMWMLDAANPTQVRRAYPMYFNSTSGGCGTTGTGDVPRLSGGDYLSWGTTTRYDCACATTR